MEWLESIAWRKNLVAEKKEEEEGVYEDGWGFGNGDEWRRRRRKGVYANGIVWQHG